VLGVAPGEFPPLPRRDRNLDRGAAEGGEAVSGRSRFPSAGQTRRSAPPIVLSAVPPLRLPSSRRAVLGLWYTSAWLSDR